MQLNLLFQNFKFQMKISREIKGESKFGAHFNPPPPPPPPAKVSDCLPDELDLVSWTKLCVNILNNK